MQTIEMLKKRERVLALQIQLLLVVIGRQATDLSSVISRYFRLRDHHLSIARWSKAARKRCKAYCLALQSGNILEAAKHAECKADIKQPAETIEGAVARLVALDFERRGLAENIGWIEESLKEIEERGPTHFLNLVDVHDPDDPIEQSSVDYDYPSLVWVNNNRVVRNRAYYELCVKFGLKRLRRAVKADIKSPVVVYEDADGKPDPEQTYGKVLHRGYASLLLERFLTNNPDQALVGTVSA